MLAQGWSKGRMERALAGLQQRRKANKVGSDGSGASLVVGPALRALVKRLGFDEADALRAMGLVVEAVTPGITIFELRDVVGKAKGLAVKSVDACVAAAVERGLVSVEGEGDERTICRVEPGPGPEHKSTTAPNTNNRKEHRR
jgi:hypothetical protein